jgi:hypothetical protein
MTHPHQRPAGAWGPPSAPALRRPAPPPPRAPPRPRPGARRRRAAAPRPVPPRRRGRGGGGEHRPPSAAAASPYPCRVGPPPRRRRRTRSGIKFAKNHSKVKAARCNRTKRPQEIVDWFLLRQQHRRSQPSACKAIYAALWRSTHHVLASFRIVAPDSPWPGGSIVKDDLDAPAHQCERRDLRRDIKPAWGRARSYCCIHGVLRLEKRRKGDAFDGGDPSCSQLKTSRASGLGALRGCFHSIMVCPNSAPWDASTLGHSNYQIRRV